ncbi:MAG: hypothetical protein EOP45_09885 [Sphingobacteriaceae bacterium]|nr:MAG: hypothetical protein EOP45_09885 [Sphingobacteriaceae bacterium]
MKRIILALFLLSFVSNVFSQQKDTTNMTFATLTQNVLKSESRFILNVHGGYAVGLGSTFKFYPDNVSSISVMQVGNNTPTKTTVYSSPTRGLGEGFRFGAGVSYILNDFINVGLDVDYFKSTIYKDRDSTYTHTSIIGGPNGMDSYSYKQNLRTSYDATLVTLSPNITFKAISKPKWFLYNKLGAVITFRPNSTQRDVETVSTKSGWQNYIRDSGSGKSTTYEWGIRNPAFGFMGGVGAQFRLNQKIRAFGELQFSHIVFVVRKRTTTDYMVNGKDMLETLSTSQRLIEFSTSFTESQQANPDPATPSRAITERIPITYVGFQAGLTYRL